MALRSDFTTILIQEHLGDKVQDLNVPWAQFVGNQTIPKRFEIDGNPRGKAYLLIQAFSVDEYGHNILINGKELSGFAGRAVSFSGMIAKSKSDRAI